MIILTNDTIDWTLNFQPTEPRMSPQHQHFLAKNFSRGRYGSVSKVYVVCTEDQAIPDEFQRWTIKNGRVKDVKEIQGGDHMPMFSMPQQLCDCLLDIANKYA
ncbi:Alpha/beta hydrolase fold-1 [Dillenia turbinata]|uniref:Alpha/beta hydrolase fold-1 n=1 Tax=Dillenia turbinata TaxID=194707 RepID=A0AAN8Z359_9MAGN